MAMKRKLGVLAVTAVALLAFASACFAQGADKRDVIAAKGVVAAAHPLASQVGVDVLKAGGNAFDAAIATAFAIHVAEPNASDLRGGGFASLYAARKKNSVGIGFSDRAPAAAPEKLYELGENGKVRNTAITNRRAAGGGPGPVGGTRVGGCRFRSGSARDVRECRHGRPSSRVRHRLAHQGSHRNSRCRSGARGPRRPYPARGKGPDCCPRRPEGPGTITTIR